MFFNLIGTAGSLSARFSIKGLPVFVSGLLFQETSSRKQQPAQQAETEQATRYRNR
jgi:hypothetical protein